jgi:hypothetical protein
MIRYSLRCDREHVFESWFKSGSAFEALKTAGHLSCPSCGSSGISKAIMSPRVSTEKEHSDHAPVETHALSAPSGPVEEAISNLRKAVEENSEYVGTSFAETARKMHDGDIEHRSIHGEASRDDAKSLIDDGVPVMPLPFTPKSKAN